MTPVPYRRLLYVFFAFAAWAAAAGWAAHGVHDARASALQEQSPTRRNFTVKARKYSFSPARIEVVQNDLVKVTLDTEDIAHSFTVDEYRIAKRASPHQPATFEFRADQPGTFRFYCNLTTDDGCKQMRGELVVLKR